MQLAREEHRVDIEEVLSQLRTTVATQSVNQENLRQMVDKQESSQFSSFSHMESKLTELIAAVERVTKDHEQRIKALEADAIAAGAMLKLSRWVIGTVVTVAGLLLGVEVFK